jgi:KpsF/GutQ family protein
MYIEFEHCEWRYCVKKEEIWRQAVHVWQVGAAALAKLATTIDREALIRCVEVLGSCRGRIITSGAGTSAAAAKKIAHSLSCVERPSFFLSPADALHGALGVVQTGDIAILISKGGGTREIVDMLPPLHNKEVFIISVTEKEDSTLAKECDLLLKVKVDREADAFNMLATTSTMAVVAVFDAICIALIDFTNYTLEKFAVIHPGGAVGERLLKRKV